MLHIICHQGNTSSNNKIELQTYQNGQNSRTLTTPNADKDLEHQELPLTTGGSAERGSHFGRQSDSFLQSQTYFYDIIL